MNQAITCRRHHRGGARPGIFFALALVAAGTVFLLDHLGHLGGFTSWQFWPLLLVLLGLSHQVGRAGLGSRIWGVLLIAGGGLALVHTLGLAAVRWDLIWPVGLVVLGAVVIFGIFAARRRRKQLAASPVHGSAIGVAVMASRQDRWGDQEFDGGEIKAVMGELEMDLSDAVMKGDEARLRVKVVMGEVRLRVPREWQVLVEGSPTLGEVKDRTRPFPGEAELRPRLVLECDVVMGSLEVSD